MTRAVVFDWRGTLVTTPTEHRWVEEALLAVGGEPAADAPGVDCDAALHRSTYLAVLADAGLDAELAGSLYAVESDLRHDRFALDVGETLGLLHAGGIRVAVLSDIHVDLRPAFAAAGLEGLVDVFALSSERGVQEPDPRSFAWTLGALGVQPDEALVEGDRSGPDGAAVGSGVVTLLVPPLRAVTERRLHRVLVLCGLG